MNKAINSYKEIEKYLQNKQVYFKKEIANVDLETFAESGKVHNVGNVQISRLNKEQVAMTIDIDGVETTIVEYKNDKEFYSWLIYNFVPVKELVNCWYS